MPQVRTLLRTYRWFRSKQAGVGDQKSLTVELTRSSCRLPTLLPLLATERNNAVLPPRLVATRAHALFVNRVPRRPFASATFCNYGFVREEKQWRR